MHRLTRRVVNMERRAFGSGTCAHQPPLVVFDGDDGDDGEPCWCGRPRLRIIVQCIADWGSHHQPTTLPT